MPSAPRSVPGQADKVVFELARFEQADRDRLLLQGRWFGVRGRRFVRPTLTLLIDGQRFRALADLEHKPWAAEDGEGWEAAFRCELGGAVVQDAEVAVAPDIAIALPAPGAERDGRRIVAHSGAGAPAAPRRGRQRAAGSQRDSALALERRLADALEEVERLRGQVERLRGELEQAERAGALATAAIARRDTALSSLEAMTAERDAALRRLDEMTAEHDAASHAKDRAVAEREALVRERDRARDERRAAIGARDQARVERDSAARGRDRAVAERDAVVRARKTTIAERASALSAHGQAIAERDAALNERDHAIAERDAAMNQRDQAIAERDDALRARESASLGPGFAPQPAGTLRFGARSGWAPRATAVLGLLIVALAILTLVHVI